MPAWLGRETDSGEHPRLAAAVGVIYRDNVFTSTDNLVLLPSWARVDAEIYYNVTSMFREQINIEKVFDEDYYLNADSNPNITPASPRARSVRVDHALLTENAVAGCHTTGSSTPRGRQGPRHLTVRCKGRSRMSDASRKSALCQAILMASKTTVPSGVGSGVFCDRSVSKLRRSTRNGDKGSFVEVHRRE